MNVYLNFALSNHEGELPFNCESESCLDYEVEVKGGGRNGCDID